MARPTKQAEVERDLIERSQRLYMDLLNARLFHAAKSMNAVVRNLGLEVTERRIRQDQQAATETISRRPVGRPRKTETTGGLVKRPKVSKGRRSQQAGRAGKVPVKRGRAASATSKLASNGRKRKGVRKKAG